MGHHQPQTAAAIFRLPCPFFFNLVTLCQGALDLHTLELCIAFRRPTPCLTSTIPIWRSNTILTSKRAREISPFSSNGLKRTQLKSDASCANVTFAFCQSCLFSTCSPSSTEQLSVMPELPVSRKTWA